MKRFLLINIVLLYAVTCFSQNESREGIIRTYQEQKVIRTRDIYVQHFYNKKDTSYIETYSDYDGKFSIIFPEKTKYPTSIIVKCKGDFKDYEVVNTYDINNIKKNDKNITVFIGNKNIINRHKELFYEIITAPIVKQYQDSIRRLNLIISNLYARENIYKDSINILNKKIENLEKELSDKQQRSKDLSEQLEQTRLELTLLKENPLILQNEINENNSRLLIETFQYFSNGDIESAKKCIPKNFDNASDLNVKESKVFFSFHQILAMIYEVEGKLDSAIIQYEKSLSHIKVNEKGYEYKYFSIHMSIAELENILRNYDNAINNLTTAYEVNVNVIYKIKTYNLWAKVLQAKGNKDFYKKYKEAIDLYEKFKKEVSVENIPIADKEVAQSYRLLANYYLKHKNSIATENNYLKSLDIYISLNKKGEYDQINQVNMLLDLASFYTIHRNTKLVGQCFNRIDVLLKMGELQEVEKAVINEKMGNFNLINREFDKAIEKYNESLNFYLSKHIRDNGFEIAKLYFNMGMVKKYLKEYEASINYYDSASTWIDSTNNNQKLLEGFIKASIGKSYIYMDKKNIENIKKGEYSLSKATAIANEIDSKILKKYIKQKDDNKFGNIFPTITYGAYYIGLFCIGFMVIFII